MAYIITAHDPNQDISRGKELLTNHRLIPLPQVFRAVCVSMNSVVCTDPQDHHRIQEGAAGSAIATPPLQPRAVADASPPAFPESYINGSTQRAAL